MLRNSLTIGVTGLQAGAYPAPGVEVAKSLVSAQFDSAVSLIGIDYDPLCSGLFLEQLFSSICVIPSLRDTKLVIKKLSQLVATYGMQIFIPNLDCDVELYSTLAGCLKEIGIKTFLPHPSSLSRIRKDNLRSLVDGTRLYVPKTNIIRSKEELAVLLPQCNFPVVVKGKKCGAFSARSIDGAYVYAEKVSFLFGWPVIVQEFIIGAEYSVLAIADADSKLWGCAAIKKLGVTDDGQTWSAVTVDPTAFLSIAQDIASVTRWIGPFEFDILVEEQTGKTYIIDFNPRFSSWVFVATQAGANLPKLLIELINDIAPEKMVLAKSGLVCSLALHDIIKDVEELIIAQVNGEEEIGDAYRRV